ncbi:MAG: flavodoxin family protein [Pseudomonadota bacterium]
MAKIEIIYFSGYGHTTKMAEALLNGASTEGEARLWSIPQDGVVADDVWQALDAADAIIFGGPTYMGSMPWQFKRFADASSARWMQAAWADKLAGGFTNSASLVGDKGVAMGFLQTLAAQHGMLWVSLGQMPANASDSTFDDRNHAGGSAGPLGTSPSDADSTMAPRKGDLQSAYDYGVRVSALAARLTSQAPDVGSA